MCCTCGTNIPRRSGPIPDGLAAIRDLKEQKAASVDPLVQEALQDQIDLHERLLYRYLDGQYGDGQWTPQRR